MKLRRVGNGFLVPRLGSRWIGWFCGKSIKGYHKNNGVDIGYHEWEMKKIFFI